MPGFSPYFIEVYGAQEVHSIVFEAMRRRSNQSGKALYQT